MNAAEELMGEGALARHGARAALICGSTQLSYADLARQLRRAAGAFSKLGLRPGERVLLLMRDTPEMAAAWLGIVWAGGVAIALNTKLSEDDYRHIRADSGARITLIEDVFASARPDLAKEFAAQGGLAIAGAIETAQAIDWRATLAAARDDLPAVERRADDPAFWLYSSGTTGRPKGIIHTQTNLLCAGMGQRQVLGLQRGDRVLATSKLFFSYALEHGLLGPLSIGATAILHPEWADPDAICALVADEQPSAFYSVPSFYRRLLDMPERARAAFAKVRYFVSAGERLPASVNEAWQRATGREILGLYGMSETFCVAMMTPPGTARGPRTGRPLEGVTVQLREEGGAEVDVGKPGVLWIRHPALAVGYANRPEANREQFVDGWFCTRDVFVRDAEGFYAHQGRSDDFIKVAGQWVQPGDVEEAVLGAPEISEAACVPATDESGFERLALFIVPTGDPESALSAAQRACEARLARHKRPRWFRAIDEIPRTATGKMQRFKLREMLEQELGTQG
ncbi:MAG: benzoate-CoA ligase family protein [Betaproteobacteria bacterium]|jgi:benzoate-CoA ligase family protein|nr:benzoate-CoA ligase family protein [Betaproteobacteria bacterium]